MLKRTVGNDIVEGVEKAEFHSFINIPMIKFIYHGREIWLDTNSIHIIVEPVFGHIRGTKKLDRFTLCTKRR